MNTWALLYQKGSHWREPINNLILKYHENGKLAHIKQNYLASQCKKRPADQAMKFDLLYLSGVCVLLVVGVIISFFVILVEHIIAKFCQVHLRHRKGSYNVGSTCKKSESIETIKIISIKWSEELFPLKCIYLLKPIVG